MTLSEPTSNCYCLFVAASLSKTTLQNLRVKTLLASAVVFHWATCRRYAILDIASFNADLRGALGISRGTTTNAALQRLLTPRGLERGYK